MRKNKTKRPEAVEYIDVSPRTLNDGQLFLSGSPEVSFEFEGLPSVNTHYNKHHHARGVSTAEWRYEAREKAKDYLAQFDPDELPLIRRALVVVNVWIPHEGIMDIHNVHIKPILDGFSEAQLWKDDEWAFVPIVMFRWAGIEKGKRITVFDIYELTFFQVRGEYQKLPLGRNWNTETHWKKFMKG